MSEQFPGAERRSDRVHSRPVRGDPSPGRRRSDFDPRTTITRKMIVVTVVLVDALYLAGEALLFGQDVCP